MVSTTSVLSQAQYLISHYPLPLLCVFIVIYLLRNKFRPGLLTIPGPAVAAYTNLWRVYSVFNGHAHLDAIELHKKYGTLVRIGPNHVSVSDPSYVPVFYGIKEDYTKVCSRFDPEGASEVDTVGSRPASTRYNASPGRSSQR